MSIEPSDEELLAGGVAEDFGTLYERTYPLIRAYLRRRVGARPDLVLDLVAETFARALERRAQFDPQRGPAVAWLLGIANHLFLDSMRRGRVADQSRRRLGMQPIHVEDDQLELIERESASELLRALDRLPGEQRDAIERRVLQEALCSYCRAGGLLRAGRAQACVARTVHATANQRGDTVTSDPYNILGAQLTAAAAQQEAARGRLTSRAGARRLRRLNAPLITAIVVLAGGAIAAAATGILTGSPVSNPAGPPVPHTRYGVPVGGGSDLLVLRAADPEGGLAWGMRIVHTTRGLVCVQVGLSIADSSDSSASTACFTTTAASTLSDRTCSTGPRK